MTALFIGPILAAAATSLMGSAPLPSAALLTRSSDGSFLLQQTIEGEEVSLEESTDGLLEETLDTHAAEAEAPQGASFQDRQPYPEDSLAEEAFEQAMEMARAQRTSRARSSEAR